ncbi:MAG: CbtA family protein [Frankiales bacterium]|nr:CbtA family protein [Frankiales bacterium]
MAPVGTTLLRGLLAGAGAGLATGLVGLVFAEPTLDAAIALETGGGDELFSRGTQQFGLVLGLVLVGAALGLLFGLAYRLVPAETRPWHRSLLLALGGFTALYLVPFLRYPANPPGVGDLSTLESRTSSYLLCIALGLAVVTGSYAAVRALDRRGVGAWQRQVGVTAAALLIVSLAYALLPDAAAPLGDTPAGLVWDFRLRSLGLQALLYAVLGTVFGIVAERSAASRPSFAERA